MGREGGKEGLGGSDDVNAGRERRWRNGELREGGLIKGTSEEGTERGMDGTRERGEGGRDGGREEGGSARMRVHFGRGLRGQHFIKSLGMP